MISLLHTDCTRVLDGAVAQERVRYAAERLDFHFLVGSRTVREIHRILREEASSDEFVTRPKMIAKLLRAQQASPHPLWTLLLTQAFESLLVRRRRALSAEDDASLDQIVVETFAGALEDIPHEIDFCELRTYVVARSRWRLARAIRAHGRKNARPAAAPAPLDDLCASASAVENDNGKTPEVA